ncbi:MAG: hypothetical protein WED34_09660, partial [Planctomycetales bacterium]
VLGRVQQNGLSAIDTEKLVARMVEERDQPRTRGAPVMCRRFVTKNATVVFSYRKRDVSDTDLLMTLREVTKQIIERSGNPADFD